MELVYLVYAISLLHTTLNFIGTFIGLIITCAVIVTITRFVGFSIESWDSQRERELKSAKAAFCDKWLKRMGITLAILVPLSILIPSEKTAYMMVGAYAAQKVAENEKVQATGQKVLTIIEQKLDTYIDEGIKESQKKIGELKDKK